MFKVMQSKIETYCDLQQQFISNYDMEKTSKAEIKYKATKYSGQVFSKEIVVRRIVFNG